MARKWVEKMIEKGEVLYIEGRNNTKYAFRDGNRNEIWTEWNNDFEHVHPASQWLVKLLTDARRELSGLQFERAKRFRSKRLNPKNPTTFEEAEGRIAALEQEVQTLKEERKTLRSSISSLKGRKLNKRYTALLAENAQLRVADSPSTRKDFQRILKENHKLRTELATIKLNEWLSEEE